MHWRLIPPLRVFLSVRCLFGRHWRVIDEDGLPRCVLCHTALSLFSSDPSLNPGKAGAGLSGVRTFRGILSRVDQKEWWNNETRRNVTRTAHARASIGYAHGRTPSG